MGRYESDAAAEVLRDVEMLADWLFGECHGVPSSCEWPHVREASAEDFRHVTSANLIGLMFDTSKPAIVTQAARDELANRFLALPSSRDAIDRIAARMEADDAADREEVADQFRRVMGYSKAAWPTAAAV